MNAKIIATLVIIPVILYALAKGGMEYKAKSVMDNLIEVASPDLIVSYKDLTTDIRGQTQFNEISAKTNRSESTLTIDRVVVSGPGPVGFVMRDYIAKTDIPTSLHLFVDNLHIPLDKDFLIKLVTKLSPSYEPPTKSKKMDGCEAEDFLSDIELIKKAGFRDYTINSELRYDFSSNSKSLYLEMDIDIVKMGNIRFTLDLENVDPHAISKALQSRDLQSLMEQIPALASVDYSHTINKEFATKYKEICAEKRNMSLADYNQYLYLDTKLLWARKGIKLGYGLKQTLKKYISEWGEIRLSIRPDNAYPLNKLAIKLASKNNSTLAEEINLDFSLNNDILTDLNYSFERATKEGLNKIKEAQSNLSAEKKIAPIRYEYKFVEIPKDQINNYLNNTMILVISQSRTGLTKELKGRYVETVDDYIHLKIRLRGRGSVKIPTKISRIKQVKVLKRVIRKD